MVKTKSKFSTRSFIIVVSLGLILAAALLALLLSGEPGVSPERTESIPSNLVSTTPQVTTSPTSIWLGLLGQTPVPITTPLPDPEWTPLDGVYAKLDPSLPQWWACKRCADYRPAGGIWKLQFDKGVMRIYYDVTGWRSFASYTVSGDRLTIFNDPHCPQDVGEYTWKLADQWNLENRSLSLEVVDDGCSIRLRGENLGKQAWLSCLPPNEMTGASDHWHKPPGCEQNPEPPHAAPLSDLQVAVVVHPGYTRDFTKPPDLYANANPEESQPPEGILVTHSEQSIAYGLNRVLWGSGDWVQAATDLPFEAMGVQIFGDHTIGWARVIFDGVEVWRGDTAAIWSHLGRHGGYIEVSAYDPGLHTIRVESLGFDYHPVTVAYFGFSNHGGVEIEE